MKLRYFSQMANVSMETLDLVHNCKSSICISNKLQKLFICCIQPVAGFVFGEFKQKEYLSCIIPKPDN